jgi:nucleoside-diphosphate-sugar epimerase
VISSETLPGGGATDYAMEIFYADADGLRYPAGYNAEGMSFSAGALVDEVRKYLPGLSCSFIPDERQEIADSWPLRLDDSAARRDWDWRPAFGLEQMVEDMTGCV